MMKPLFWLAVLLIVVFILAGCTPVSPTTQPSPTILPATDTLTPTSTSTPAATETPSPIPTQTPLATLDSESVKETEQPLLQNPMNCTVPCFWGITPGKTSMDEVSAFFDPLGFQHREGTDPNSGRGFYSVGYDSSIGRDSNVTFYAVNNLVEDIEISPDIIKQKEGIPRDWIAYSPETLIKKYGKPSRVGFALDLGQVNKTIDMVMYFDTINLIAIYEEVEPILGIPHSIRFCPLTAQFDYVWLGMGPNPINSPLFSTVPLGKATSLTIDQFTQLILGDRQKACFIVNGGAFQ